jgi:hypothetical protein
VNTQADSVPNCPKTLLFTFPSSEEFHIEFQPLPVLHRIFLSLVCLSRPRDLNTSDEIVTSVARGNVLRRQVRYLVPLPLVLLPRAPPFLFLHLLPHSIRHKQNLFQLLSTLLELHRLPSADRSSIDKYNNNYFGRFEALLKILTVFGRTLVRAKASWRSLTWYHCKHNRPVRPSTSTLMACTLTVVTQLSPKHALFP